MQRTLSVASLVAILMTVGCGPLDQQQARNKTLLLEEAEPGRPYAELFASLAPKGYVESKIFFGPPRDVSAWDKCLKRNVSYPMALAGGDQWLCVRLDEAGRVTDAMADEFVWGL